MDRRKNTGTKISVDEEMNRRKKIGRRKNVRTKSCSCEEILMKKLRRKFAGRKTVLTCFVNNGLWTQADKKHKQQMLCELSYFVLCERS